MNSWILHPIARNTLKSQATGQEYFLMRTLPVLYVQRLETFLIVHDYPH